MHAGEDTRCFNDVFRNSMNIDDIISLLLRERNCNITIWVKNGGQKNVNVVSREKKLQQFFNQMQITFSKNMIAKLIKNEF